MKDNEDTVVQADCGGTLGSKVLNPKPLDPKP